MIDSDKSLNISSMYQKGIKEFFKLLPKALYFGLIFFLPYLIFRYTVTPSESYGWQNIPFLAEIFQSLKNGTMSSDMQNIDLTAFTSQLQQITSQLQNHASVTGVEDFMHKINWYIVGAEIFRLIMISYFAFYIIYLCVGYAKDEPLNINSFFAKDFHRKFGRAVLAQLLVVVLIGILSLIVLLFVGFFAYFLVSFILQQPQGAIKSAYIALAGISFLGLFFILSVVQFFVSVFISGYLWCLAIGIMYHDISFSNIYNYALKLFKGNFLKVFGVFLLNAIIVACVGIAVKILFWPLKIAFLLEKSPMWIFDVMRDIPLISTTNLMLGILTTAFFIRLEYVSKEN